MQNFYFMQVIFHGRKFRTKMKVNRATGVWAWAKKLGFSRPLRIISHGWLSKTKQKMTWPHFRLGNFDDIFLCSTSEYQSWKGTRILWNSTWDWLCILKYPFNVQTTRNEFKMRFSIYSHYELQHSSITPCNQWSTTFLTSLFVDIHT